MTVTTRNFGLFFAILWLISGCGSTQTRPIADLDDQITSLTNAFDQIAENKIPSGLLKKSQAVVITDMAKAGFMVALQKGSGLMVVRNNDEWSNPALINLLSASFGIQAGVEVKKIVLVFTKREVAEKLAQGNIKLGAGLSLAVGPLAGKVGTEAVFDKDVYSYSSGVGIFAGLSLEGASLKLDDGGNQSLYGKAATATEIFGGAVATESEAATNLKDLLQDKTS